MALSRYQQAVADREYHERNWPHIKAQLNMIGLTSTFAKTGSERYARAYLTNEEGISVGRMTIERGDVSHIKWYGGGGKYAKAWLELTNPERAAEIAAGKPAYVAKKVRSERTGRLICSCRKGYASEDEYKHYGICTPCYIMSLSAAQRRKLGLKKP